MRYGLSLILCLLLFALPALADESGEVQTLLRGKVDAVMALLQDKTVAKADRNEQIIEIVTTVFDYQAMAKLSLGKKYWPALNEAQQASFSTHFIKRLQESYLDKLDLYSDEQVLYGEPLVKGKQVHVPTTLVSKGSRIGMLYKLYRSSEGWKIYDVEIGGVSVIQTYRSQFDGILREGTIENLIDKLKAQGAFALAEPGVEGAR